jgi:hypothetical protein
MTATTTCQMTGCDNAAEARPVYDANPDPKARKVTGHVAICNSCQDRVDRVNSR